MNRRALLATTGFAAMGGLAGPGMAAPAGDAGAARPREIAAAATGFLDMLGQGQRLAVQLPFLPQPNAVAARFKGGKRGDVDMVGEQYGQATWSNSGQRRAVLGPGHDGEAVPPAGVKASALDARQRAMLYDLVWQ